jgi:hypothetical protein
VTQEGLVRKVPPVLMEKMVTKVYKDRPVVKAPEVQMDHQV